MRIGDVLGRKGSVVATVRPTATIAEALVELERHNIGALVVTDHSGAIAGILSERDVVRRLPDAGGALLGQTVAEVMSTDVTTTAARTDLVAALRMMTELRVRHLPVVEDGDLIGIVSIGDIVKYRIDELQAATDQLESYISGG